MEKQKGTDMCDRRVTVQAEAMILARETEQVLCLIMGPGDINRGNNAEAVLADALGLPGRGEHHDRVSRGLADLDEARLRALLPVLSTLLAVARGYVAFSIYREHIRRRSLLYRIGRRLRIVR
ncbi:hypothetical protein [Methylobacterium sp. OAE515]|uniref:hypothetical protein n=1 Tax=Methylobacterium sp. OAE515 TaxID=2817895 RepID=UPI0017896993